MKFSQQSLPKSSPNQISLEIPPLMWHKFRKSMLQTQSDNAEVIGFFFCQRHQISKHQIRYFPKAWVVPTSDCYESQSIHGLVLKQDFHFYLLEKYLKTGGLDVIHIHTHALKENPEFSGVDDRAEAEYARFLSTKFPKKPRLISGVFNESMQDGKFRIWHRKGNAFETVNFYCSWFPIKDNYPAITEENLMFTRQKIFGETLQKQLGELTVSLIGCGGIGAVFAEQLGRLGVKKWVLIDPDRLENVNLNRMPGATWKMTEQQWYKVEYVKQLIKQIYPIGSCVQTMPKSIQNESVLQKIATSDLIVVATDNHRSRQIAQELALKYMRPLVCLGTHIDIKSDGVPRMYCRVTIPPLGGNWCLMCGNIINLQQAALECAATEIENLAAQAGYLQGINDPAVFWLNSICASTAVGIIQGMISGFLNVEEGLDWIYQFPESQWHKTNTDFLVTPDCYFCASH